MERALDGGQDLQGEGQGEGVGGIEGVLADGRDVFGLDLSGEGVGQRSCWNRVGVGQGLT